MSNIELYSNNIFYKNNIEQNLVSEEMKALKKGDNAYCFNDSQLEIFKKLCQNQNIEFTYKKDEDNIYVLTPTNVFRKQGKNASKRR